MAIDRYVIEGSVGEGGMAVVYRARHRELGSVHALKQLKNPSELIRQRLIQEGQLQSSLSHPNVLSVTDLVMMNDAPTLVMEYVEGPSLADLLAHYRPTIHQCDSLVRGILKGVAAAHRHGLIHRDLKPANILIAVTQDGLIPKIADFGLAKALEGDQVGQPMTQEGSAMGTPAYMAPEQIRDASDVDGRADIFSLGAILYEMIAGEMCFGRGSIMEIWDRVCSGKFMPVESYQSFPEPIPQRMVNAIEGALKVNVQERIPDVNELLRTWSSNSNGEHQSIDGEDHPEFWSKVILEQAKDLAPQVQHLPEPSEEQAQLGGSMTAIKATGSGVASPSEQTGGVTPSPTSPDSSPSAGPAERAMAEPSKSSFTGILATIALMTILGLLYWGSKTIQENTAPPKVTKIPTPPVSKPVSRALFALPNEAPKTDKQTLFEAQQSILKGELANAEDTLSRLIKSRPDSPLVNAHLALLYFLQRKPIRAAELSRRAHAMVKDGTRDHETLIALFDQSFRAGSENVKILGQWQVFRDTHQEPLVDVYYLVSTQHNLLGKTRALEQVRRSAKLYPADAIFGLIELYLIEDQGRSDDVIARAETLRRTFPKTTDILMTLARALIQHKKYEKAEVHLKNALIANNNLTSARALLARIFIATNQESKRLEQLLLSLSDAVPVVKQIQHLREHGQYLYFHGRLKEALKVWKFCIDTSEEHNQAQYALECSSLAILALVQLDAPAHLKTWLALYEKALLKPELDPDIRSYYSLQKMLGELAFAAEQGDRAKAFYVLGRVQKQGSTSNAFGESDRLRALLPLQMNLAFRDVKDLEAKLSNYRGYLKQSQQATRCTDYLVESEAAFLMEQFEVVKQSLGKILSKKCLSTDGYPVVRALALVRKAQLLNDPQDSEAKQKLLAEFDELWPAPTESLPIVQAAKKLQNKQD